VYPDKGQIANVKVVKATMLNEDSILKRPLLHRTG
jgi:hypothetical protein